MEKKIYVLTCVNEDEQIIELRAYHELKYAQITMREEYELTRRAAGPLIISSDLGNCYAQVSYDNEFRYTWEIHATSIH